MFALNLLSGILVVGLIEYKVSKLTDFFYIYIFLFSQLTSS